MKPICRSTVRTASRSLIRFHRWHGFTYSLLAFIVTASVAFGQESEPPFRFNPWVGAAIGDVGVPVAQGDTDSYDSRLGPYGVSGNLSSKGHVVTNSTS